MGLAQSGRIILVASLFDAGMAVADTFRDGNPAHLPAYGHENEMYNSVMLS